jgi:DNA primase
LPKGADPADMARRDPAALKTALERSRSFLDFRVRRALESGNLRTPEGRAKTAEAALAMVAEHPNPLVREQYIGEIAGAVDISVEQLTRSMSQRGAKVSVTPVAPRSPAKRIGGPETEALKVAIHEPEQVAGKLHEVLFKDATHHDAFLALASGAPLAEAIEAASPDAADLLRRLAVEDSAEDPGDVVAGLVRIAAAVAAERVRRAVPAKGDFSALSATNAWLKQTIALLDQAEQTRDRDLRSDATVALVAWLAQEADTDVEEGANE